MYFLTQIQAHAYVALFEKWTPSDNDFFGNVLYFGSGWNNSAVNYTFQYVALFTLLLAIQILVNIITAVLLVQFLPKYIHLITKKKTHDSAHQISPTVSIYWSFVGFGGFLLFTVLFSGYANLKEAYTRINLDIHTWLPGFFHTLNLLIILLEFIFCTYKSKGFDHLRIPSGIRAVAKLICCDFITKKKRYHQFTIAVSLWIVMAFIQTLSTTVVPLVLLAAVDFVDTVFTLSMLFSTFFFTVILTASLIHNEYKNNCWPAFKTAVTASTLVVFTVMVVFATWLLINSGFADEFLVNIIVSLLLPAALTAGAVFMKNKFLNNNDLFSEDNEKGQETSIIVEN